MDESIRTINVQAAMQLVRRLSEQPLTPAKGDAPMEWLMSQVEVLEKFVTEAQSLRMGLRIVPADVEGPLE